MHGIVISISSRYLCINFLIDEATDLILLRRDQSSLQEKVIIPSTDIIC